MTNTIQATTFTLAQPFDESARSTLIPRFRQCPPEEFLAELRRYTPTTGVEELEFAKYLGWTLYDLGENAQAKPHLLRALRLSSPHSRDRALLRGLLSEIYSRTGDLHRAERCCTRALVDLPQEDPGNFLRGGHLMGLGRVLRRRGEIRRALGFYRTARSLLTPDSPHWSVLIGNSVVALTYSGELTEADEWTREERRYDAVRANAPQRWCLDLAETLLARAMRDPERALRVTADALRRDAEKGERVRTVLTEARGTAHLAAGELAEAERCYDEVLARCQLDRRHGDLIASASRGLTEVLALQGRHEEACHAARRAIACGSAEDRVEHVWSLRLLGRSLHALQRPHESLRAFREAMTLHDRMEFASERSQLEHDMAALSLPVGPGLASFGERSAQEPLPGIEVLHLADGRAFRTTVRRLAGSIRSAAASRMPVLIEGEPGTGKELMARFIHERSLGPSAPFVVVDCGTLTPENGERELFGSARGAGAGAPHELPGLVGEANGGTLFVDELHALPGAWQVRLLRAVQEKSYRRDGDEQPRAVDVRLIAATHERTAELLDLGKLHPDLFRGLNGHRIPVPPLRERKADIGLIAEDVLARLGMEGVEPDALAALCAQHWPGNVRQLELVLGVAATRGALGRPLELAYLHLDSMEPLGTHLVSRLRDSRRANEREHLQQALKLAQGNVTRAAAALGISRQAFYKAIRRHGIERDAVGT